MAARYELRLARQEREGDEWKTVLWLDDDAFGMVGWLLSATKTISRDDPLAREQLRRLLVVTLERWDKERTD